jgi:predicted RNA-binding protein Jag
MAQRFEGKNLEEALDVAAAGLGVPRYQLTYHVVLEKRGFLGGMKRVVIEADINETAAQPAIAEEPVRPSPRAGAEGRVGDGRGAGRGRRGGRGRGDRGASPRGGGNRDRGPRRRRDENELQPGDFGEQFDGVVPEQGPESEGAGAVRRWCEEAAALARLDVQARSEENETQVTIRLYGRDARLMTDRHGELLDALQVLANKALVGRKIEKDIELDCQEFKGRRTEQLEERARRVADQVRRDGREQLLPAMTPIERRIVHLALRDDGDVTTESRGDGFYKRVAIIRRSPDQEQSTTAS